MRPRIHLVELMRKTANTDLNNTPSIVLDSCIVRVSKNWFVVIGMIDKNAV